MSVVTVTMKKKIVMEAENGEMKITRDGDTYRLEYHNRFYKNSPFKVPTTFSTDFTIEEIISSHEVTKFMRRFD